MLHIADNLDLPLEAVTETFAILGKRGTGKTSTAVVITEEMLAAGQQVVVFDPVGVWWGLRSSADGESAGLPIVILGGEHADVPLSVDAGAVIADLVVDARLSVVLDVSEFSQGEQTRFITAFAETLYVRKSRDRQPMHLVLDEADAFVPQQPLPGEQRMLGAMDKIVRRGRVRGIGITLISQRPAVIHKNTLTQTEVLVTMQLTGPQDRKAIDDWISAQGTSLQRKTMLESVAGLPIGTAWLCSPRWLGVFERVSVRRRRTFDSSATPKVGQVLTAPKRLAEVDLEALRTRLAATIEAAQEDDPQALHARIRDLERRLAEKPVREVERIEVEVPIFRAGEVERLEAIAENLIGMGKDLLDQAGQIHAAIAKARDISQPTVQEVPAEPRKAEGSESFPTRPLQSQVSEPIPPEPVRKPPSGLTITAPQQRILDALATMSVLGLPQVAKSNVAVFAGQSPTSSGYTNNLGRLRSMGLVDYPIGGFVALTDAGTSQAESGLRIRSLADLHNAWFAHLRSGPKRRILEVLIGIYPKAIQKEALATRSHQSPTSSGYTNNLGALRSLGLIDYPQPGYVMATPLLFPKGLS